MPSFAVRSRCLLALATVLLLFLSVPIRPAGAEANDAEWADADDSVSAEARAQFWRPKPGTTWQWQLTGRIDTSVKVDVYNVDVFDVPAGTLAELRAQGRKLICYINVGAWERWRSDAPRFPSSVKGEEVDGWPGERWLDIRRPELRPIMAARLDLCKSKGFHGVEFDNAHNYTQDTGFKLTYSDNLLYMKWLASAAHQRGLSAGLKNNLWQIRELLPYFEFGISEECFHYNECELLTQFIKAGKAVFHVEYVLPNRLWCPRAKAMGFSSMKKRWSLDAFRDPCS